MSRTSKVLPVRILKIWFDVVLVLSAIAYVLFLGWLVVSPFLMARGDLPVDGAVQVVIGERSWFPVFALDFEPKNVEQDLGIQKASLVKARGELRFLTTRWWLHITAVGEIVMGSIIVLYVIWTLRRVLINVLAERPFDAANGQYLNRCGYITLVVGAVWPVFDYLLSSYVLSRIDVSNIDLRPAITLDSDAFTVGLLFLVFGAILSRGHELQEHEQELEAEQELTI